MELEAFPSTMCMRQVVGMVIHSWIERSSIDWFFFSRWWWCSGGSYIYCAFCSTSTTMMLKTVLVPQTSAYLLGKNEGQRPISLEGKKEIHPKPYSQEMWVVIDDQVFWSCSAEIYPPWLQYVQAVMINSRTSPWALILYRLWWKIKDQLPPKRTTDQE